MEARVRTDLELDGHTYYVPFVTDDQGNTVWAGDVDGDSYSEWDSAMSHAEYKVNQLTRTKR